MSVEAVNCVNYPFREKLPGDQDPFAFQVHETPYARHDLAFPYDSSVTVRTLEARHLDEINLGEITNGGFNLRKWIEKAEDGTERVRHAHLEILPAFDTDTANYLRSRIKLSRYIQERVEKARAIAAALPQIRICPDMAISMVNSDTHFFSITKDGNLMMNARREKVFQWAKVASPEGEKYQFQAYITDVEDTTTQDEYRVIAGGSILRTDMDAVGTELMGMIAGRGVTGDFVDSIARLSATIIQK